MRKMAKVVINTHCVILTLACKHFWLPMPLLTQRHIQNIESAVLLGLLGLPSFKNEEFTEWRETCKGRKLSRNLGAWRLLAWQKRTIRESFLHKNRIFHQFEKFFFLKSFPIYSTSFLVKYPLDSQVAHLVSKCLGFILIVQYLIYVMWKLEMVNRRTNFTYGNT